MPRPIRVPNRKARAVTTEKFRKFFSVSAGIFVFVGITLSVLIWVPSMETALAARATVGAPKIQFAWPAAAGAAKPGEVHTWLPSPVRDELLARISSELERHPDPFSSDGLRATSDSLMRTGWFDSPPQVRRRGEAVAVSASWRTPAAVVRRNGVDYLISQQGHLLPVAYQRDQAPVTAIIGAVQEPPMASGQVAPGQIWQGDDIRAALDTLGLIAARPWRDQVSAIDVTEYSTYKRLAIISKWNGKTVIGGAPRDTIPGEVAFDMKLRRIDELARQFGQIDARHRLVEVGGPVMLVDDVTTAVARNP